MLYKIFAMERILHAPPTSLSCQHYGHQHKLGSKYHIHPANIVAMNRFRIMQTSTNINEWEDIRKQIDSVKMTL